MCRGGGHYLALAVASSLLLQLAERVRATSRSGTRTSTWGLCTKPRPLCTPTCSRRSRTCRVPPDDVVPPYRDKCEDDAGWDPRVFGL